MSDEPIVMKTTFNTNAAKLWRALTDSEEMQAWYFDIPAFKAEPGFEFTFKGGSEEHQYLHRCKIIAAIPGKKLMYSWRYDGYPGNSTVAFEIFEEDSTTTLQLTHSGVETLGPGNPDFARKNFEEGWTNIIGSGLKKYIEKTR